MTRIFDKLGWVLAALVSLAALAALAGFVRAGPLDPPGPVGSTDKTVITSLPFTINQEGSYVLKGNLTGVSGQNGITVAANNVTIDLQGFELVGVPGSLHGIAHTSGSLNGLTVRNGTVRNWGQLGISAGLGLSADGVGLKANGGGVIASDAATLTNCRVEGSSGLSALLGNRAVVNRCTFDSNGSGCTTCPGIQVGQDSSITESLARNNGGTEIQADAGSTLENCTADGNRTAGNGIQVGWGSTVRGCSSRANGGGQIFAGPASVLEDCVADGDGMANSVGIYVDPGSIISDCTASNNGGLAEIYAGDRSLIEDCVVDGWTGSARGNGDGILIGNASLVRGCTIANNAGIGLNVAGSNNRVEGNHVRANSSFGINVPGSGNVFAQNDSALNRTGAAPDNCNNTGSDNDFIMIINATTGAGTFDNICDHPGA